MSTKKPMPVLQGLTPRTSFFCVRAEAFEHGAGSFGEGTTPEEAFLRLENEIGCVERDEVAFYKACEIVCENVFVEKK